METLITEISCSIKLASRPQNSTATLNTSIALLSSSSTKPSSSATKALLNADKSTAPASPLLPLPSSRSLFPCSLKFLWFGKDQNPASTTPTNNASDNIPLPIRGESGVIIAGDDSKAEADSKPYCTCSDGSNCVNQAESEPQLGITDGNVLKQSKVPPHDKSWVSRFLKLNLIWRSSDSKLNSEDLLESALVMAADQQLVWNGSIAGISRKELLDGSSSTASETLPGNSVEEEDIDGDLQETCLAEAAHERVVHDRDSIAMYLHEVPITQVQEISKLCLLSNLAYIIPEVQSNELLKEHNMSLVTSSFIKKEAEAKALSDRSAAQSASKEVTRVKKKRKHSASEGDAMPDRTSALQADGMPCPVGSALNSMACPEELIPIITSDPPPSTSSEPVAATQQIHPEPSPDQQESNLEERINKPKSAVHGNCPCEWFICDDKASSIRYLVIQGSESLGSWQTNLSFDPTKFEGLGVLVHRGIYEAAQGLYNMVVREIEEHVRSSPAHDAKVCFTGHSLGGSLATLLAMMLVRRGVVQAQAVEPVVTLGAPCVLCAGDQRRLLSRLGLRSSQFVNVVMHRDIVPRAFACDYPDHVARVLKRVNGTFRDHPCLNEQHLLYAPVGQVMILQPHESQSPGHPLLPATTAGLFLIKHPQNLILAEEEEEEEEDGDKGRREERAAAILAEERDAHRAFFNSPHPLEMLRDPGAYGFEGAISRDHDPRSYHKAVRTVILQGLQRLRRHETSSSSSLLIHKLSPSSSSTLTIPMGLGGHGSLTHPLKSSPPTMLCHVAPYASPSPHKVHVFNRYASRLIASKHIHMGLLFILSIATNVFSSLLSWA